MNNIRPIIAVSNQKGGVGKTTTVVNIAALTALAGIKTLVIDSDAQGNASSVLAPDLGAASGDQSIYTDAPPRVGPVADLWILPGGPELADQERRLAQGGRRGELQSRIAALPGVFDLIIIDCPPNLGPLTVNALIAATHLLIPIQCEYFAMEGLGQLLHQVEIINGERSTPLQLASILLTMYDASLVLNRDVEREIRRHFGVSVLRTPIPRDVALAAAPSHGKTIVDYDPLSVGAIAYLAAVREFLHGLR